MTHLVQLSWCLTVRRELTVARQQVNIKHVILVAM